MTKPNKIEWATDDTPIYTPTSIYRAPTLQEKLERIQAEIAKMNKNHAYPDTEPYDHLKSREAALKAEIERQETGE